MKYIQTKEIFSKILEIPWSFSGDPKGSTEPWLGLNCGVRHVSMKQTCRGAPSVLTHLHSCSWTAPQTCLPLNPFLSNLHIGWCTREGMIME